MIATVSTSLRPGAVLSRAAAAAVLLAASFASWGQGPPVTGPAAGADPLDSALLDARDAALNRKRPGAPERLAAARAALQAGDHPLRPWVDYWDLSARLAEATPEDVDAFLQRWKGSYVEDRLRNDWLLELGKRRDFTTFARIFPAFRMNDDREVTCYALLTDHLGGKDVREAARRAWFHQREADDGCSLLSTAMVDAGRFTEDDIWIKARLALESLRVGTARQALGLLRPGTQAEVNEALTNPARYLRRAPGARSAAGELRTLAAMRLAQSEPESVASLLAAGEAGGLTATQSAWLWAYLARQSAFKLDPQGGSLLQNAFEVLPRSAKASRLWTEDMLSWGLRAALRTPPPLRWRLILRLSDIAREPILTSSATPLNPNLAQMTLHQRDAAWPWWRAQALLATAADGTSGEPARREARQLLEDLAADGPSFHGLLAADALQRPLPWPTPAAPSTAAERETASTHPGLRRALHLARLDLRSEAVREWNFSLRGMGDRELLAAARVACDAGDWQLCINTAERTRQETDLQLRYPQPWGPQVRSAAQAVGLDPHFVTGLIRQESRFMPQLRSSVGATGLMQVMPATGRWTARKFGLGPLDRPVEQLADPATNLRIGTLYLRSMLDDLDQSQAMAAAGYNAGPNRPRRWREGSVIDAAIWTDTIPFHETRDYVRKVLTNAAVYEAMASGEPPKLRPRLGATIGPRAVDAPPENKELP